MTKYTLEHDRPNCIGCGACAAVCPKFWEMAADGKSDIKDAKTREDSWQATDIEQDDFEGNKEAADACPVNVIHITDKESGQKLI